jgi:chromosome segregation ATPase
MPEISARDLKRLQALDERLRKAQAERRELTSEVRAMRAQADTAVRAAAGLEEQVGALVQENRTLADALESIRADLAGAEDAAVEARRSAEEANRAGDEARASAETARAELERTEAERSRLAERVKAAETQLADRDIDPVVPPSRVAELVDGFVRDLGAGMSGLDVSRGELRLRLGVANAGDQAGFVVPSILAERVQIEHLQEVTLHFERRLGSPPDLPR